ncbi:allene oxide synthase-lipoxygenase protein [Biomphalaria pfeifferi]|uniref:Allene oxide synthase-lipoxygenase protein n=1 Tax=Biomphalaria pfeifferi TaxID=112525 RepID=A0AAD8FHU6_BIOPF|nr:allene oxide synthase-lipoxygenase protein [Biomphalaria pfeifferi]
MFSIFDFPTSDFTVDVITGKKHTGDVSASVGMVLFDEAGNASSKIKLGQVFQKHTKFHISSNDTAELNKEGDISRIEFWVDGARDNGSKHWHVNKLEVRNNARQKTFVFPVQQWVVRNRSYKVKHLHTSLPQLEHEEFKDDREEELKEKKRLYELDQKFPGAPVQVKKLPKPEEFTYRYKQEEIVQRKQTMVNQIGKIPPEAFNWQKIEDIFSIYDPAVFPKPKGSHLWSEDVYFGRQRLAIINNTVIELVKDLPQNFPVSDELVGPFLEGLTLKEAIDRKRLFMCDLKVLEGITVKENFVLCAPIALFFLDKSRELKPVAIQLLQSPSSNNPIFTPACPTLTWTLVKMWYNNADAAYHQGLTHLGFTHLLMESFDLATQRNLSSSHPVYKLLEPHFLFLMAINSLALTELINKGGWVDVGMNYGRTGMLQLIANVFENWRLDVDGNFHEDMRRRGLDDPNVLPSYHFRDDALLLYNAINDYVLEYLSIYYTSPDALRTDHELQNWAQELVKERNYSEGGMGIKGVPGNGKISSLDQLQQILTCVIFTCSVKHASANFGQYDEYGFPANYPLTLRGTPPTDPNAILTEADILASLPDGVTTLKLMTVTKLLSDRGTNSLGNFETEYIVDPIGKKAVESFRMKLAGIGEIIKERNANRTFEHTYLLPEFIPNSISI